MHAFMHKAFHCGGACLLSTDSVREERIDLHPDACVLLGDFLCLHCHQHLVWHPLYHAHHFHLWCVCAAPGKFITVHIYGLSYIFVSIAIIGGYVLMQVVVLLKRGSFKGFGYAVAAGITGIVGLMFPN